jgi:hypothetical protein
MSAPAGQLRSHRAEQRVTRLMGGCFAVGATGFVIGPLGAYLTAVGAGADALTFFVSSILFTAGGLTQAWLAHPERGDRRHGRLAWRAAWIQAIGTLLFNLMTLEAISRSPSGPHYDAYVWVPNALGSACFLVSGVLLYLSSPRNGWRPRRRVDGWWEPPVNLLGCVLFGVSAIAGYAVPPAGRLLAATASNWTTTTGAVCFVAIGLPPLLLGMTFKVPRLSRLVAVERTVERAAEQELSDAEQEIADTERTLEQDVHEAAEVLDAIVEGDRRER